MAVTRHNSSVTQIDFFLLTQSVEIKQRVRRGQGDKPRLPPDGLERKTRFFFVSSNTAVFELWKEAQLKQNSTVESS
jgi:hypothetical protein